MVELDLADWAGKALEDFSATLPLQNTLNLMAVMIDRLDHDVRYG
jgi:hypothetical protein